MSDHTCMTCPACLAAFEDDGATFNRLSRSFDGTKREWSSNEKYQLFVRGFRDGAAIHAMRHPGLGAYELGYAEGQQARGRAVDAYAKKIGHVPTILRTATTDEKAEER